VSEVIRQGHAHQFAKWRRPPGLPKKGLAGLRRLRHQLRPRGAGQETMEARMVSKVQLEAEQNIHVLLSRGATTSHCDPGGLLTKGIEEVDMQFAGSNEAIGGVSRSLGTCLDSLTLSCSEISGVCIKVVSCGLLEGEDGVFTL
jgi:hypothetical protein